MGDSLNIVIAALETACAKISKVESQLQIMDRRLAICEQRIGEVELTTSAKDDLTTWMGETSKEPAYEVQLTTKELSKLTTDYFDRKA